MQSDDEREKQQEEEYANRTSDDHAEHSSDVNQEEEEEDELVVGEDDESSNTSTSSITNNNNREQQQQQQTNVNQVANKLKTGLVSSLKRAGSIGKKALSTVPIKSLSPQQQQQPTTSSSLQQQVISTRVKYLRENNSAAQKIVQNGHAQYLNQVDHKLMELNVSLSNTLSIAQDISFDIRTMNENLIALNKQCEQLTHSSLFVN